MIRRGGLRAPPVDVPPPAPRQCPGCGAVFDGDTCPNMDTINHDRVADPLPAPPLENMAGAVIRVAYGEGTRLGIVASDTDADGSVAVMLMVENLRVPLDDLEVITDGSTTP